MSISLKLFLAWGRWFPDVNFITEAILITKKKYPHCSPIHQCYSQATYTRWKGMDVFHLSLRKATCVRDYFLLVPSDICLEKTYILSELDLRWFILSRDKSNPTKHKPFVALWRTVQCVSCFPPVSSWKAKVSHETRGKKVEIGSNFQIAQLHLNRK